MLDLHRGGEVVMGKLDRPKCSHSEVLPTMSHRTTWRCCVLVHRRIRRLGDPKKDVIACLAMPYMNEYTGRPMVLNPSRHCTVPVPALKRGLSQPLIYS